MQILKAPHPLLKTVCRPDFVIDSATIDLMFAVMHRHEGAGLAAPQVGIDARLFVTAWGEVFVNPKISLYKNRHWAVEGCLSLEGRYKVYRYEGIVLEDGRQYYGHEAQVIQHECDHLNGILISDEGIPQ